MRIRYEIDWMRIMLKPLLWPTGTVSVAYSPQLMEIKTLEKSAKRLLQSCDWVNSCHVEKEVVHGVWLYDVSVLDRLLSS